MKAVILCAGEGERLKPLTNEIPKPLILLKDKPILEYILSSLPEEISEVILVIQEKHKHLFEKYGVKLIFQDLSKKGTYFALLSAIDDLKNEDKFLVLNGDDIFLKEDMEKLIHTEAPSYGIYFKEVPERYRTCDLDEKNMKIRSFRKQLDHEKGKNIPCFSGSFTLTKDFFNYEPVFYDEKEAGIPHTLFNNNDDVSYTILSKWIQINTKEDLKEAENTLPLHRE